MNEAAYLESQLTLFEQCEPQPMANIQGSLYGRTSQGRSVHTKDMILELSWKKSQKRVFQCLQVEDGQKQEWYEAIAVKSLGECQTPNIGEYPSVERESFLSQILEDNVPGKYYLSQKACLGILRRAKARGKELPEILRIALEKQSCLNQEVKTEYQESTTTSVQPSILHRGGQRQPCVAQIVRMRSGCEGGGEGALVSVEKSLTLAANTNDQVLFQPTYCIAGNTIDRKLENGGNGKGINEEVSFTLNTIDRHAVVYASTDYSGFVTSEITATLKAKGGNYGGGSENLAVLASGKTCTGTLLANCATKQWLGNQEAFSGDYSVIQLPDYIVRRLTPTECERLQGLPDGYTAGGSDSARYKALGNGMAQPCADFVMQGIARVLNLSNSRGLD